MKRLDNIRLYPAKNEKVRWIVRENIVLLLDPKKGTYHKLNETAALVWQFSNGINNQEDIRDLIFKNYKINKSILSRDIYLIIRHFNSKGFIKLYKNPKKFIIKNESE